MTAHPPRFEALEGRALFSGTIAAVVSGGALTLTGDAYDNAVTLTRNGDTVTLTPDAGAGGPVRRDRKD